MSRDTVARRFFVSGRVQGVGYRYFVLREAGRLGVSGYTRNLDDGRVEVYAAASEDTLKELARRLRQGPLWSDVRDISAVETALERCSGFEIRG